MPHKLAVDSLGVSKRRLWDDSGSERRELSTLKTKLIFCFCAFALNKLITFKTTFDGLKTVFAQSRAPFESILKSNMF